MSDSKSGKWNVESRDVAGHKVEVRTRGEEQQLHIDGARKRFFVNKDGYRLYENAYVPPTATLLEAVELYLSKAPRRR